MQCTSKRCTALHERRDGCRVASRRSTERVAWTERESRGVVQAEPAGRGLCGHRRARAKEWVKGVVKPGTTQCAGSSGWFSQGWGPALNTAARNESEDSGASLDYGEEMKNGKKWQWKGRCQLCCAHACKGGVPGLSEGWKWSERCRQSGSLLSLDLPRTGWAADRSTQPQGRPAAPIPSQGRRHVAAAVEQAAMSTAAGSLPPARAWRGARHSGWLGWGAAGLRLRGSRAPC